MFEYLVRPHVCLSVSVHVAFYFKLGFISSSSIFFWGGVCFLKWSFVGGGGGYTLMSWGGGGGGGGVIFY